MYKIEFTLQNIWIVNNQIYKTKYFQANLQNEIHQPDPSKPNLEKPNLELSLAQLSPSLLCYVWWYCNRISASDDCWLAGAV